MTTSSSESESLTPASRTTTTPSVQETPEDSFTCPICLDYLSNATEVSCCYGCFCKACIEPLSKCPLCRKQITTSSLRANVPIQRLVNALKITCQYCSKQTDRGSLMSHLLVCEMAPPDGICGYCDASVPSAALDYHKEKCSQNPKNKPPISTTRTPVFSSPAPPLTFLWPPGIGSVSRPTTPITTITTTPTRTTTPPVFNFGFSSPLTSQTPAPVLSREPRLTPDAEAFIKTFFNAPLGSDAKELLQANQNTLFNPGVKEDRRKRNAGGRGSLRRRR
eukprot:TRINITY_DN2765_c0_g1_i1.p1 TRINITY_DN2765_c0_g1~~TRINITY_DN2765_c0_g1_i1.p1  ORF type:complete len:278 (+),score=48.80 TRINITY_DN2765_c0_g1_i1:155-988(+)